jgi:hypothetical protein
LDPLLDVLGIPAWVSSGQRHEDCSDDRETQGSQAGSESDARFEVPGEQADRDRCRAAQYRDEPEAEEPVRVGMDRPTDTQARQ